MSKPKILIQLDTDTQASVFDGVVAVDAGVDQLFRHAGVMPEQVRDLVYGAMFTRGPSDLKNTAVFVGGSDVQAGEQVLDEVTSSYFGHIRVSAMIDSNGCNTTAAAAVLSAAQHVELSGTTALILASTGPVGLRAVGLLARQGAMVRAASRTKSRAEAVCSRVKAQINDAQISAWEIDSDEALRRAADGVELIICAGAAGVQLLPSSVRDSSGSLKVAIDLNAVPPLGVEGIQVQDRAKDYGNVICYGAVGVGENKMKIHKAAIRQLFESNDQLLDAESIFELGRRMP